MSVAAESPDLTPVSNVMSPTNVFYFLLIPALVLWYAYWRMSRRHMYELAAKIPGPTGIPLLGNALEFIGSSHGNLSI